MKRVLCVVASLNAGGAEIFLMKVLRAIDKNNYMLDFIVSAPGIYDEEAKSLGSKIYVVPLRTEHPLKTFMAIRKIVKNNSYKYFLKLCDTPMGTMDLFAAKLGGAKHISVRSCNASSNSSKAKELVYSLLRPIFNKMIDCKIAPSELAAEYTFGRKTANSGQVSKLNNGVDTRLFRYDNKARESVRKEYDIEDETVLLGHIGRFNKQKNHEFLINVFKEYHTSHPNSKLMLIGEGELFESIKIKVEQYNLVDSVIFTGVKKDIPRLLSGMDIFLLPSYYEGMPNTVIEAQATGLKCIVSNTITNEANITGLVKYLPINNGVNIWVKSLSNSMNHNREAYSQIVRSEGYEINSVLKQFVDLIFDGD